MSGAGQPFRRDRSCCQCLCRWICCKCCRGEEMNVERKVWVDGRTEPNNTISNAVNNQKYNVINFIPLVLFNQFKLFFNFFQLAINLSQLVPILKVGNIHIHFRISIHLLVSACNGDDSNPSQGSL